MTQPTVHVHLVFLNIFDAIFHLMFRAFDIDTVDIFYLLSHRPYYSINPLGSTKKNRHMGHQKKVILSNI